VTNSNNNNDNNNFNNSNNNKTSEALSGLKLLLDLSSRWKEELQPSPNSMHSQVPGIQGL